MSITPVSLLTFDPDGTVLLDPRNWRGEKTERETAKNTLLFKLKGSPSLS